jgi:DedD protein
LAQDDYYYEIQLTNKQLVFYFMAGATGLILSFLAGVMVGRGVDAQGGEVQAARAGQEERTISEETPRPASPAASPAELSYAQRLESDKPDESLAKPQPAPSATTIATPAPAPPARAASAKPTPAEPPAAVAPTPAPKEARASRESTRPAPEGKAAESPTTPAPTRPAAREPKAGRSSKGAPAPGAFTIQVGAFKDGATAETVVARLKGKGFSAFVVPPEGDDGLFLVRVGSFSARADAERTETKLRDQEKFKPYIVKN